MKIFDTRKKLLILCFFGSLANFPEELLAFPVLYGDSYTVTVQFEGESPNTISPIYNWGTGEVYNGGDLTGTAYEALWIIGSQPGYVAWRTFSVQREGGLASIHVLDSQASIVAQVSHPFSTYADFVVNGLDGWKDYPSLSVLNNSGVDVNSIKTDSFSGVFNTVATNDSLSFRVPVTHNQYPNVTEFYIGFKGLSGDPVSVPAPLPILGAVAALGWSRKLRRRIKESQKQELA
jgi:hypothetical protein